MISAQIFNNEDHRLNLYGSDVEVDYRGRDVDAAAVLDLLLGRHEPYVPATKRLRSDSNSNVLVSLMNAIVSDPRNGYGANVQSFQSMHHGNRFGTNPSTCVLSVKRTWIWQQLLYDLSALPQMSMGIICGPPC